MKYLMGKRAGSSDQLGIKLSTLKAMAEIARKLLLFLFINRVGGSRAFFPL